MADLPTIGDSRMPLGVSRRVPLGLQVILGIGGLVALVVVAVVLAVFFVSGLRDNAADLTDREVQYARAIDAAALRAKAMANDERGFLLSGKESFLERFERRAVRVQGSFVTAEIAAEEHEQREGVREARAGFLRWLRAVRAEVATYKAGDRESAVVTALGPTRDLRYEYETSLRHAQRLGSSAIESGAESVSSASSQSITVLLVYLIAALIIGVIIGIWIVRTILRPVYALLAIFAEPGSMERVVELYSRRARRG
jgi:methyl-accepting chemotaxis protein